MDAERTINTIKDFILRVEALSDIGDAYYVFEDECTEELRLKIYGLAIDMTDEPFREAMHFLGYAGF